MKNEIQIIEEQAPLLIAEASAISITSPERMTEASELRERLKNTLAIVEEVKEKYFRPAKNEADKIAEKYNPTIKKLEKVTKDLSEAMGKYQTSLIASAKLEADKIASRVKEGSGNLSASTAMERMNAIERPEVLAETSMINKPIPEITDPLAIPREYLVPDMKLIEAELKAGVTIPGVHLVDNYQPRSRR